MFSRYKKTGGKDAPAKTTAPAAKPALQPATRPAEAAHAPAASMRRALVPAPAQSVAMDRERKRR